MEGNKQQINFDDSTQPGVNKAKFSLKNTDILRSKPILWSIIAATVLLVFGGVSWAMVGSNDPKDSTPTSTTQSVVEAEKEEEEDIAVDKDEAKTEETKAVQPVESKEQSKPRCVNGKHISKDGKNVCRFEFNATDVPARLEAVPLQTNPLMNLYDGSVTGTCGDSESCIDFQPGVLVTSQTKARLDWKIVNPNTITVDVDETLITAGIPAVQYNFKQFIYEHPAQNICTSEHLYCYTLRIEYEKVY